MSSIRRVQTERLLQDIVHMLYSAGVHPTFSEVSSRLSQYFSKYPAGDPLPLPRQNALAAGVSNVESYNQLLAHLAINLDVLYESSLRQVEEVMLLTNSLQTNLERLKKQRRRAQTKMDDFLLALYNSDGYFYSTSDTFSDTYFVDLTNTTAQVNTEIGVVMLPAVPSGSNRIALSQVGQPVVQATVAGSVVPHTELAPFAGALEDSLDNILWAFEVETTSPQEVLVEVTIPMTEPVSVSRIDVTPYGATPVQLFIESRQGESWASFGNKIQTGTSKMTFGDSAREVTEFKFTLRKLQPDYSENVNNQMRYKYIFGARDLSFIYQVYERHARVVSQPLVIPAEYEGELVIDAVSLDVEENVPADGSIRYYVAGATIEGNESYDSLLWKEVIPIGSSEPGDKVVRFGGAAYTTQRITEGSVGGDLELLPSVSSGPAANRNPSAMIVPGVDVYRLAKIADTPLVNSLKLIEGVNTTRIRSRNVDLSKLPSEIDLDYWSDKIANDPESITVDYGRIDAGNEFFYGGDVGASGKDVFIEAYVTCDRHWDTFLAEFQKVDVRSQTWDVKLFLNGRPLGDLPVGTHKLLLPWKFREGLNHIIVLARIPLEADESHPFMGALSLLGENPPLYHYGSVNLARWNYVDFFTMKYNETGEPYTFTIHDGEIISRRRPTANFELQFASGTGEGPEAIRFRADLSRTSNNPNVSPVLNSYRIRYSYSEES